MSDKMNSDLFSVSPKKIVFYAPYICTQKRLLTILNPTGQRLLYKICTNTRGIYNAVPNCGCIEPYDIIELFISLRCLNLKTDQEHSHHICVQCIRTAETDNIEADTILSTFKQTRHHMIQNVRVGVDLRPEPLEISQEELDILLPRNVKRPPCCEVHSNLQLSEVTTLSKTQNSFCRTKCCTTLILFILTGLLTGELQTQLA